MTESFQAMLRMSEEMDRQGKESFSYRALFMARYLLNFLFDEKGDAIPFEQSYPEVYYPLGTSDSVIWRHQENFLKRWNEDKNFVLKFRKFSLPVCHHRAEEIIRTTLQRPKNMQLEDWHVKQAAVVACLTPLRQSIGSCFATAPAILVQNQKIDLLIDDLYELLMTGRLKRVVDGNEYIVPMSISSGELLKVWEYTLASFCDVKREFSKWNLSGCVGLNPQEIGGIGEVIYQTLEEKLQNANRQLHECHHLVIDAYNQLKTTEALLKQASTEAELRRLQAEQKARLYHLKSSEALQITWENKAKSYADFFPFLIREYTLKFQEYFQEIYDPEMVDTTRGPYEDSRAGFRLVYKHGRADSSLWTFIENAEQFIRILTEFFSTIEHPLAYICETEDQKTILEEMTTVVIQHIQREEFLKSTLERAASKRKLPWAYLSGGTVDQIIPIYFQLRSSPISEKREVQDELDLFIFLIEIMKSLPTKVLDHSTGFLMESPTHVFTLLPDFPFFRKGWLDSGFTYTWIRDQFLHPARQFYADMILTREQQLELMHRFSLKGDTFQFISSNQFFNQFPEKNLPSLLYSTLPLIPADQCKAVLQQLLDPWLDDVHVPASLPAFISSQELQQLAKAQLPLQNRHELVAERARTLKLAPPICHFADTNWQNSYFAFVIHPVSLNLEIWKADIAGCFAQPIPIVSMWLGKGKEFSWTIYPTKF